MRSKRSNRRRLTKSTKVVRGAKYQSRPSASYHYNTLNNPVGFQVTYRPRKGGKYILHELALRSNGSPYWKALEALPKKKKQTRTRRRSNKRRSSRRRSSRRRSSRRRSSRRRSSRRRSSRRRSSKGKMDGIPLPGIDGDIETQGHLEYGDSMDFLSRPGTPDQALTDVLASSSDSPSIGDLYAADLPLPSIDASLKAPPLGAGTIDFDHSGNQGRDKRDVRKESLGKYKQKKAAQKNKPKGPVYKSRKKIADNRPRVKGRFVKTGEKVTAGSSIPISE